MRKTFLALALTMGSTAPALASEPLTIHDYCEGWFERATLAMEMRQNDVSMPEAMRITESDRFFQMTVESAYQWPLAPTDLTRYRAIREHGNMWAAMCYRGDTPLFSDQPDPEPERVCERGLSL